MFAWKLIATFLSFLEDKKNAKKSQISFFLIFTIYFVSVVADDIYPIFFLSIIGVITVDKKKEK